jgi:hypothetical protein
MRIIYSAEDRKWKRTASLIINKKEKMNMPSTITLWGLEHVTACITVFKEEPLSITLGSCPDGF